MNCSTVRISVGAYLLGGLEPNERALVDQHFSRCASCSAELVELAGLPALLGRLTLADVTGQRPAAPPPVQPVEQPTPQLLDRLLNSAAAEQPAAPRRAPPLRAAPRGAAPIRGGHRRLILVAAGVAAAVALVTSGTLVASHLSSRTLPGPVAASATPGTGVVLQARVTPRPWGTAIDAQLSGVAAGEHCQLIAVAADGRQEVAGTWKATYEGRADVTGATAIPISALVQLQILASNGQRLATTSLMH